MKRKKILFLYVLGLWTGTCGAGKVYAEDQYPGSPPAEIRLAYTLVSGTSSAEGACTVQKDDYGNAGYDIERMFQEGERLEAKKEYLSAYYLYEEILSRFPGSSVAVNLKYRALRSIGAVTLALEKYDGTKEHLAPDIYYGLLGDEAMYNIRWGETDTAIALLDRNARLAETEKPSDDGCQRSLDTFAFRAWCDRAAVLKQKNEMELIFREYEQKAGTDACTTASFLTSLPGWTIGDIADAYAFQEKPETALLMNSTVTVTARDPHFKDITLSRFQILRQLGRFGESGTLLERFDGETPAETVERGVLRDNWLKEEIAYERGWWLMYQDRFGDARHYLTKLVGQAPFNSHMRTLLAHLYLWEGSPRRALEEFEISQTMDPRSNANDIGYCYALDENGRGREARSLARQLTEKYPRDRDVKDMRRRFAVQDMRSITFGVLSTTEFPDASGTQFSFAFRQPVQPDRYIGAEVVTQNTSEAGMQDTRRRGRIQADWRLDRDTRLGASVSGDGEGREYGWAVSFELVPRDHLAFTSSYDSFSMDVPLAARIQGIKADEINIAAGYQPNEGIQYETAFRALRLTDGNNELTYVLDLNKTVQTGAYWKTRLGAEGHMLMHSRQDSAYFSPEHLISAYLVPGIEHVWFKRFERSLTWAFSGGIGGQWQKGYPGQTAWYARFQQNFAFSDTTSVLLSSDMNNGFYDGQELNTWNLQMTLGQRF